LGVENPLGGDGEPDSIDVDVLEVAGLTGVVEDTLDKL